MKLECTTGNHPAWYCATYVSDNAMYMAVQFSAGSHIYTWKATLVEPKHEAIYVPFRTIKHRNRSLRKATEIDAEICTQLAAWHADEGRSSEWSRGL